MRELNAKEIQEVNGGILPFVIAVVSADLVLIGAMVGRFRP